MHLNQIFQLNARSYNMHYINTSAPLLSLPLVELVGPTRTACRYTIPICQLALAIVTPANNPLVQTPSCMIPFLFRGHENHGGL